MNSNYGFGGDEVKEESSWRYPIGIFLATLILCAIFLYYYVGPSVNDLNGTVPSPTISEEPVSFTVADTKFSIPANYTVFPRERRGGEFDSFSLYLLWPTLSGYAPSWKYEFIDDTPDTRRINISISAKHTLFSEADRIQRLYLPNTVDQRGSRTPYRLNRYKFRPERDNVPTNGYANTTLFLGEASNGQTLALFCYVEIPSIPNPDCWREYELSENLSVTYRFKRPFLAEWKEIDTRVREFIENAITSDTTEN